MTETYRFSSEITQRELSNEYQQEGFRWFSKIFAVYALDDSSLSIRRVKLVSGFIEYVFVSLAVLC